MRGETREVRAESLLIIYTDFQLPAGLKNQDEETDKRQMRMRMSSL